MDWDPCVFHRGSEKQWLVVVGGTKLLQNLCRSPQNSPYKGSVKFYNFTSQSPLYSLIQAWWFSWLHANQRGLQTIMIVLLHVLLIVVTWFGQMGWQRVLMAWNKYKFRTTAETTAFACKASRHTPSPQGALCLYTHMHMSQQYIFVWWMYCGLHVCGGWFSWRPHCSTSSWLLWAKSQRNPSKVFREEQNVAI